MKRRILVIAIAALLPILVLGRAVQMLGMQTLISKSTLVFVGRVTKVEPSGIKTEMSYPTWKGVTFEWLNCDVEVLEPIKGVKKGQVVRAAMLSAPGGGLSFNPPGMVDPKTGKAYLLCLTPTTLPNTFAAVTAPWDDNKSIFVLDREFWLYGDGKAAHPLLKERYSALWSLVDDKGVMRSSGAEEMRKTYKTQIDTVPPTNLVIHLQWETQTSFNGWQRDVPKGYSSSSNSVVIPAGPITTPAKEKKKE